MPTFPIANTTGLGLGQIGNGTRAPALVQGLGLTVNQEGAPSSAVWLFPWSASDPAALTGQIPSGLVFGLGSYAGQIYAVNDAGTPVMIIDNGALVGTLVVDSLDLGDNDPINFGDADDIVMKWNGTAFAITQATPNSQILLGISGAGIDLQLYGDTVGRDLLWDQSADSLIFNDSAKAVFGTGSDITILWDGTDLLVSQAAADSIVKWGVSGAGINHVFYGDTATRDMTWDQSNDQLLFADNAKLSIGSGAGAAGDVSFSWDASKLVVSQLTANSAIDWGVDGAGLDQNWYGDTASAKLMWDQSQDTLIRSGAAADLHSQATTGAGQLVQVYGPDITHGWARYVYQNDLSPAAIETAIMTVPAMSRVLVVQANVQSALTGGGTTVTFGVGITGDVDAYGTASNSGVQADLLTQNAKINAMAGIAANAGASLGVFSAGTVAMKLIGAATGGASAGNTALTVGSVRVRVIYETLLPLADA